MIDGHNKTCTMIYVVSQTSSFHIRLTMRLKTKSFGSFIEIRQADCLVFWQTQAKDYV